MTNANDIALQAYRKAVNDIDDYFEYSNESAKDKETVQAILGELTDALWGAAIGEYKGE